jgi:hypothetical protein
MMIKVGDLTFLIAIRITVAGQRRTSGDFHQAPASPEQAVLAPPSHPGV